MYVHMDTYRLVTHKGYVKNSVIPRSIAHIEPHRCDGNITCDEKSIELFVIIGHLCNGRTVAFRHQGTRNLALEVVKPPRRNNGPKGTWLLEVAIDEAFALWRTMHINRAAAQ